MNNHTTHGEKTQTFKVSFFQHKRDTVPRMVEQSWDQLVGEFEQPHIRVDKDGLLFAPAVFEPAKRLLSNVQEISILCLDIDHDAPDLPTLKTQLDALGASYIICSTHSHLRRTDKNPNAEPRFRVAIPLACPIPAKDFPALWQHVKEKTGLPLDESAKDASRMFYTPVIATHDAPFVFDEKEGEFLNWEKLPLGTFTAGDPFNAKNAKNASGDSQQKRDTLVFEFHEERHTELCKRVEAQAKPTGRGTCEMKCPSHNGKGDSSLFHDPKTGVVACLNKTNPCSYFDILPAFGLPNGKLPSREHAEKTKNEFEETQTKIKPFPVPNEKCFYGLAGDFVRLVEPHTEASKMALLAQFLVYFGNICERSPHFKVEGDKQHTNCFCVLVGKTASGRKGTSFGRVKEVFKSIDEQHEKECIVSGLASGEGLLYHIRDAVIKDGKDGSTVVDTGVTDKRLLVIESEFANVLRVQGREGNTLSAFIRNLWDHGDARSLTKNSPLRTTNAHVSIIGHITQSELLTTLSEVESANGYANRFMFFAVERDKFLPFGSEISEIEIGKLRRRIKDAIRFAKTITQMKFSDEARALWVASYKRLETSRFGYLAKVTQRASPYVLRLACIFALLGKSESIERIHLETALSVWQYSEDSARYIFGERLDDQTAEKVLKALHENEEKGLTRTEIRDLFDRHISNEKLGAALQTLLESGLAEVKKEETKGRPKETWLACVLSVKSVLSPEKDTPDEPSTTEETLKSEERETTPHFPTANEKVTEEIYACLHCGADIPFNDETCPKCDKPQLPTF